MQIGTRLIAGLALPSSGTITYLGQPVNAPAPGIAMPGRQAERHGRDEHEAERFGEAPSTDDEWYPIVDDTIDLGPLVRDAIVLDLPAAPLCREDCRGLCPQCGADRNEGDCSCAAPKDPRWANLDVLR